MLASVRWMGSTNGMFALNKPDLFPGLGRVDELEICTLCCCNQGIVPIDRAEPVPRPQQCQLKRWMHLKERPLGLGHVPGDAVSVNWEKVVSLWQIPGRCNGRRPMMDLVQDPMLTKFLARM